jgi:peptidoglycan-associated lipoprotein
MNRIVISALLISFLSACASNEPKPISIESSSSPSTQTSAVTSQVNQPQQNSLPPYKDPANMLYQKRSVNYDVDQYVVANGYRPVVEAHAKYLSQHPDQKVRIEGNTDEQGSREYNLALGQRRAQAVKKMMIQLGVHEDQLEAISWGKERPKAAGHDESAWAQNRRSDIKYNGEQ